MSAAPLIDLNGRTALVTGGARGIGFGIAEMLSAAGAIVAINDIDAGAARDAAARLGGDAFAVPGDVSDHDRADDLVAAAARGKSLDILVNNAGVSEPHGPLDKQPIPAWRRVIEINLQSAYVMSRAALPWLKASPAGAIVNIASVAGLTGFPGSHAYGVSKAALIMLTKTLAGELARHGIRVNAVAPGIIDAPMLETVTKGGGALPALLARVPMARLGAPQEIGKAVAFLASGAASYVTGIVLPVDGGWLAFGGAGPASAPALK